jgi:hypothetical protein
MAPDELAVCKFVLLFIPRLAGRTGELATFENEAVIGANGTDRNPSDVRSWSPRTIKKMLSGQSKESAAEVSRGFLSAKTCRPETEPAGWGGSIRTAFLASATQSLRLRISNRGSAGGL